MSQEASFNNAEGSAEGFVGFLQNAYQQDGERHQGVAYKSAPTLAAQVFEAQHAQRSRSVIHWLNSQVSPAGEWQMGDRQETDEAQMLQHLDAFLEKASAAALQLGDAEASRRAEASRQHTVFIGTQELDEATTGFAKYWQDYLTANPTNNLYIFAPQHSRGYVKSTDFVRELILDKMRSSEVSDDILRRVHLIGDQEDIFENADPANTKIVLVDDWMSTGAMMAADTRQVAAQLRHAGRADLIDNIEVNLLVSREDRLLTPPSFIDNNLAGTRRPMRIIAYYHHPYVEDASMHTFGTHSSVDHNDSFLRSLAELQARVSGQSVVLPEAALIERPYR